MSSSPRIVLALLYALITVVASFEVTIHTPCVPRSVHNTIRPVNAHRRRRRRQCSYNEQQSSLYLHFDDFSDLMNGDESSSKTREEVNNGNSDQSIPTSSSTSSSLQSTTSSSCFPQLQVTFASPPISYPPSISTKLLQQFTSSGFMNDNDVVQFAKGFLSNREEVLSTILIQDFGWEALDAHRARVGMVSLALSRDELDRVVGGDEITKRIDQAPAALTTISQPLNNDNAISEEEVLTRTPVTAETAPKLSHATTPNKKGMNEEEQERDDSSTKEEEEEAIIIKPALWKSVLVNDKARIRRSKDHKTKGNGSVDPTTSTKKDSYNYGLLQAASSSSSSNNNDKNNNNKDRKIYGNLYAEMDNYWSYMTIPQTSAVSNPPIREQTAKVYLTHARLFLGWIVDARGVLLENDLMDDLLNGNEKEDGEVDADIKPFSMMLSSPLATAASSNNGMGYLNDMANYVRKQMWDHVRERVLSSNTLLTAEIIEKGDLKQSISLYDIFPTSETESASPILQYILWLRSERGISPNYEANILRGLIKLVKFRFAHEMTSSSVSNHQSQSRNQKNGAGANSMSASSRSTALDDLPIVIELRKLHREAGSKGKKAPRSSDEGKKWLDWDEYLQVIVLLKSDLGEMIDNYNKRLELDKEERDEAEAVVAKDEQTNEGKGKVARKKQNKKPSRAKGKSLQVQRKDIATMFQHYLILSFFACVPDRQRTFRELELGRNFIRVDDDSNGGSMSWVIKHTAEDYKTGSTYGDRPPLPLTVTLTPDIEDFLECWRPSLLRPPSEDPTKDTNNPSSFLFLQPRTGNPLTANSVYQIVSRCCYKYKQKKTNPHLLRDMIVTHVRTNADASEKELEALALFMGHSIQMQRDSYDRRTLEQKVSPAVKLMQNMNSLGGET